MKDAESLIIEDPYNVPNAHIIGDFVDMSEEDIIEFLEGVKDL